MLVVGETANGGGGHGSPPARSPLAPLLLSIGPLIERQAAAANRYVLAVEGRELPARLAAERLSHSARWSRRGRLRHRGAEDHPASVARVEELRNELQAELDEAGT